MKKTALFEQHKLLNAKIIDFKGWQMPLSYQGIIKEHLNVRQNLGLFDVSHMGKILVSGKDAQNFLQAITTNDVSKLSIGKAQYSLFCNETGGIIDDLTLIKQASDKFLLIVNAANLKLDLTHIKKNILKYKVNIENISDKFSLLALQGKNSALLLEDILDRPINHLNYYQSLQTSSKFGDITISRMGYTGEDGFELMVENTKAPLLWQTLNSKGIKYKLMPVGLGARDTLRIEAGYLLHGQDIHIKKKPTEARLSWITKLDKQDFTGKKAILAHQPTEKLVGLVCLQKAIARSGHEITSLDKTIIVGEITSGCFSPYLNQSIAMAYINKKELANNSAGKFFIRIRDKFIESKIVKLPFVKPEKPLLKK